MMAGANAGNISGEATCAPSNTFIDAMRGKYFQFECTATDSVTYEGHLKPQESTPPHSLMLVKTRHPFFA
jgi:hypothetical protein